MNRRAWLGAASIAVSLVSVAAVAFAQGFVEPPRGGSDTPRRRPVSIEAGPPSVTVFPERHAPVHTPSSETDSFSRLDAAQCRRELETRRIRFAHAHGPDPHAAYVVVRGSLSGVELVTTESGDEKRVADCRLVLALATWTQVLRRDGVTRVHFTTVRRPQASGDTTHGEGGHAAGLAIDVRALERTGGTRWDVSRAWGTNTRGADPCAPALLDGRDPSPLRRVFCDAAEEGRFHVVVTPHYDDGHRDHVHLELVPRAEVVTVR